MPKSPDWVRIMEESDTLEILRIRAGERFGPSRAEQLDSVLCQVALDLETMADFPPDPDDRP